MPIATIRDLGTVQGRGGIPSPWRTKLLPAHFDGNLFHVESGSVESGRRTVTHEFPKKDLPYSEDMGRRAIEFTVRGYIIQFPYDTGVPLYRKDYTIARDQLRSRLDQGPAGTLQLPMIAPMTVVCTRYRMTEEERTGGFVTFDMSFTELGVPPFQPNISPASNLQAQSQALRDQVLAVLSPNSNVVPLPMPRPPGAG